MPTVRAACVFVLSLLLQFDVGAESPSERLRVGVLTEWPPYYLIDENGREAGFAIDVMDAIAEMEKFDLEYRRYESFPELDSALLAGEIDVIPNMGILEQRPLLFTEPIDVFEISLFVRDSETAIAGRDDLLGKSVGVVRTNVGEILAPQTGAADVQVYGDVRTALFSLLAGDVDALIYPAPVIWHLVRQAGLEREIREIAPPLREVRRAMAVDSGQSALRDQLDKAIVAFRATPEFRQIYSRWFSSPPAWWSVKRVMIAGAALLAVVAIVLLAWRYRTVRRLNRRLRSQAHMLDTLNEAVVAVDLRGRVVFWNQAAEELYGWKREEAMGRSVAKVVVSDQEAAESRAIFEGVKNGRSWQGEFTVESRDGRSFPVFGSASPIRNRSGKVTGAVGVASDLSHYKGLELQLRQSQKREALGRLAGGIAHDFNNLLTVLGGHTALALKKIPPESALAEDLAEISRAVKRASSLTHQLLIFSRDHTLQPEVLDVAEVIDKFAGMVRRVLKENIELNVECDSQLGPIKVDRGQFEQVLMNLVVNARDSMPDGGRIVIEARNIGPADAADTGEANRPSVQLSISDTGTGIPVEIREKIFDPFFTTKEVGKGTGLGLAIAHGIVTQSGGTIEVESEVSEGTTFRITFPRTNKDRDDQPGEAPGADCRQSPQTRPILVVEDERSVRKLIHRLLSEEGFTVIETGNPVDALAIVEKRNPMLLITDVVMPKMSGPELVREARRISPLLPVLYVTGYAEEQSIDGDNQEVVLKPFTQKDLLEKVDLLLARSSGEVHEPC